MNWKVMLGPVIMILGLAVVLIFFPVLLTGTHTVINDANIADFTGLATFTALIPLLAIIAVIFSGGLLTFSGIKQARRGGGGKRGKR
jgi:hypothetical protein